MEIGIYSSCFSHLDSRTGLLYPPRMPVLRSKFQLHLPDRTLSLGEHTLVMGILNVTPDSFSDGGRFLDVDRAVARAMEIEEEGADFLDIGGESTRPGSPRISLPEEQRRVLPVLERLRGKISIPISIDTYKAEMAEQALRLGVALINDVSAGRWDSRMFEVVRSRRAAMVLMHMRGEPLTWSKLRPRRAVVQSVLKDLCAWSQQARQAGISHQQILLDPGIGFGKTAAENLQILCELSAFHSLGFPLLVGTSRKSFLRTLVNPPADERLMATAATIALAIREGVHMVRVHDVRRMREVAQVTDAILQGKSASLRKENRSVRS